jgi:hypothetical protein
MCGGGDYQGGEREGLLSVGASSPRIGGVGFALDGVKIRAGGWTMNAECARIRVWGGERCCCILYGR